MLCHQWREMLILTRNHCISLVFLWHILNLHWAMHDHKYYFMVIVIPFAVFLKWSPQNVKNKIKRILKFWLLSKQFFFLTIPTNTQKYSKMSCIIPFTPSHLASYLLHYAKLLFNVTVERVFPCHSASLSYIRQEMIKVQCCFQTPRAGKSHTLCLLRALLHSKSLVQSSALNLDILSLKLWQHCRVMSW